LFDAIAALAIPQKNQMTIHVVNVINNSLISKQFNFYLCGGTLCHPTLNICCVCAVN
jgi:hypothetical protein